MQPGPFNKNIQNQDFYNSIADIVSKINVDIEQAKIDDSPISELKMPAKDAKGNIKSRKVRGAYAKGADKAQAAGDKAMDKATDIKSDIDDTIKNIDKSLDAEDRRDDRKRKARKEEVEHVEEAVTTTLKFKKDADGAAAVGSETGRTGLLHSGKKVKPGEYKLTFKNDRHMMKFMDKHADRVAEDTEVEEGKLVDRIMRKRKQMKNKGTIPGSDGY